MENLAPSLVSLAKNAYICRQINPKSLTIMQEKVLQIRYRTYVPQEMSAADVELINAARQATYRSYAPYSHFSVGATARLADGTLVSGSNQENAAYPSRLCAERTTRFYANSCYPDQAVETLAIAARGTDGAFLNQPIPPCGACRQVMLEVQSRHQHPMRILLCGEEVIYEVACVEDLLPFTFNSSFL